jgi:acetyl esterase/lipase
VTFPIYPLAPDHTHQAAHEMALATYSDLPAQAAASQISVIGDSAGGGFCLALCQLIRDAALAQPANVILISPWLDLTMSAEGLPAVDELDPILAAPGLRKAGMMWAGDTPVTEPLLSPLNAQFTGLAPITVFVGTHDLMVLDTRRLRERMAAQGVSLRYFEYAGMFHVFAAFPIPEGIRVMRRIKQIVGV